MIYMDSILIKPITYTISSLLQSVLVLVGMENMSHLWYNMAFLIQRIDAYVLAWIISTSQGKTYYW